MKLIGTDSARLISLFAVEEIRPLNGLVPLDGIKAIAEHYEFRVSPDIGDLTYDKIRSGPFKFEDGKLQHGTRIIPIVELTIYMDGIVVGGFHTDDCDIVLRDFFTWGQMNLGLREQVSVPQINYSSTIVCEVDASFDTLLASFDTVTSVFSEFLRTRYEIEIPVHLKQVNIGVDFTKLSEAKMKYDFILQRRQGQSFDGNRIVSDAPLSTPDNILLIETLEKSIQSI